MQSPPFDFLKEVFFTSFKSGGRTSSGRFKTLWIYPKGGGQLFVKIIPTSHLRGLKILERGQLLTRQAQALVAGIPEHVAQREL